MAHSNEDHLRDLYATFAQGDLQGFLGGSGDSTGETRQQPAPRHVPSAHGVQS
jgi:hypothetical protein